jgi:hypothetical protein
MAAMSLISCLLAALASTRPESFRVERRLRIAAPADQLWPLVGGLRGFNRWNPFERKDPQMKDQYAGPANFMSKLIGVFMEMDKMVGRDFEDGLQNLRQIADRGD